jgi:hypothetical protein
MFLGRQFTYENLKSRIPVIKSIVAKNYSKSIKDDEEVRLLNLNGAITGEVVANTFFGEGFWYFI